MNLAATMSLQAGAFLGPLQQVRGQLAGTITHATSLAKVITGLGGAFAAFKSAESVIENFFKVFEKGHALEKLHRVTGESVQDLVVLQKAFTAAGVDSGDLQRTLTMLQKALGGVNEQGEPTKFTFEQLGLSIQRLQKLSAPEQFAAIGEKIRALPSAAQRTAAAMSIFGRSGAEMLAVLDDPNALQEAMKSAAELGALYQRNAKIFSQIAVLMASIKGKVSGLFAGLAEGVAPAFKAVLEAVKSIDLAKIGRDLGALIGAIPRAIEQGKVGDLVGLSLQLGFAKAVNFLSASMMAAGVAMGEVLSATFSNLGSIKDILVGAAAQFGAALLTAIQKPLALIQGIMVAHGQAGMGDRARIALNDPLAIAKLIGQGMAEGRKIMAEGGPVFGFGGDAMNPKAIAAAGQERITSGITALNKPLAELAGRIFGILKDFKITDVTGAGDIAKKLKELLDLLAPKTTPVEGGEHRGAGAGLGAVANKLDPLSDRLARIGGFIGGAGGPGMEHARRTADNTATLVQLTKQLPSALQIALRSGNYDEVFGSYR